MWFRRKSKPSVRYADFQPTTHRAPRRPPTPPTVKLDPIAPQAYDWLLNDAARLLESAADARRDAAQLIENATEYEIVAASYRRLAAMHCPDAPGAPQPQPEYAEPQHPADPDPSRFNPTWQIPDRQRAECGCAFWLGESCASCDGSVSEYASILTPWSPTSEADAAGWNDAPRHGQTEQFPLVNGEVR